MLDAEVLSQLADPANVFGRFGDYIEHG